MFLINYFFDIIHFKIKSLQIFICMPFLKNFEMAKIFVYLALNIQKKSDKGLHTSPEPGFATHQILLL